MFFNIKGLRKNVFITIFKVFIQLECNIMINVLKVSMFYIKAKNKRKRKTNTIINSNVVWNILVCFANVFN